MLAAVVRPGYASIIESGAAQPGENSLEGYAGITPENFEDARQRAAAIVSKLTLDEKISQFNAQAAAVPRLGLREFNYYSSEALHGLNHVGPVTSFPVPLALGCTWNRSLIQQVFAAVSDEMWAWHKKNGQGLAVFSPPTVNMGTRDPRWGRIAENYSEDPYLVGEMATYTIRGMQGNDPRFLKTIACAKHYAANDTESDRETTSAAVDPRSFWEYYSRGFHACVRAGVFTVMSSYNSMNGVPTTASRFLLTDLLRERWGFRGYVVSDCDAVGDICRTHHFVPTYAEAAALAINAGCDIDCGDTLSKYLGEAVEKMLVSQSALDQSLIRSFTGRVLLGEFDPPEQIPYNNIPVSCLDSPAHRELAREAARQSVVLFKNENHTLPLDQNRIKKLAVIGPMANVCTLGNYSGTPWLRVSPLQGIKDRLGIPTPPSYRKRGSEFSQAASSSGGGGPFGEESLGPRIGWCSEGGEQLTFISDKSWAAYDQVLFTGANQIHARVASDSVSGTIEVHLDSIDGPLVAELKVSKTGGGQKWVDVSAPLKPATGVHTVYLRLLGGPLNLFSGFSVQSFRLTPETAIPTPHGGKTDLIYAEGCAVTGEKDPALFAAAVNAAKQADVVLLFVGSDERVDGETLDRDEINLPGAQHELVQAVYGANPRTVLVISSNCPVAVNWEQDHLPAIVGGLCMGEQQGHALADVLFGSYNPGGKLSTTWYRGVDGLPDFHDYNVRHGRTYMYFRGEPLYPFGFGLSYTAFDYKNLQISGDTLEPGNKLIVSAEVTNTGSRDGDEIPQLYVHLSGGPAPAPSQQLIGFERVHLKAGETRKVSFEVAHSDEAFCYWDESKNDFVLRAGMMDVMVGASSADIRLTGHVQLAGGPDGKEAM